MSDESLKSNAHAIAVVAHGITSGGSNARGAVGDCPSADSTNASRNLLCDEADSGEIGVHTLARNLHGSRREEKE